MYLYIFENGEFASSVIGPTPTDRKEIRAGVLVVIRFDGGNFEYLTNEGIWVKTLKSRIDDIHFHAPPEKLETNN